MKNKKNIYFLVPAVLLIWGLIGYRVYKALNPSETRITSAQNIATFIPKKIEQSNSYEIQANYRDPFLGTITSKTNTKNTVNSTTNKILTSFPTIIYKGIVSPRTSRKSAAFFIQINGQQSMLNIGGIEHEVKLISGNKEEVVLQFKKQRKTFTIQ
ncbi:hypothetical protein [Urechidicola croceus]|uniref:Type II secretion system protein GspC N-terminal domain-containing protein n=1 Tax=Urechidicola croceus TaxID=1850246 RepID=A0A1D8P887_9FLAO|nr:hypothetical protein [Urechidicola croceus]AOW20780.1 hypothetical protein LPB138_08860 [Urechidicola croceus]